MVKVNDGTKGGESYPGPKLDDLNQGTVDSDDGRASGHLTGNATPQPQMIDPKPGGGEFKDIPGLPFIKQSDMV